nr:MAG TPA: Nuclease [Caudoviricetes sp.]
MREKYIEQRLVSEVKKHGGLCLKLSSTGLDGIPDRMVLMSKGKIAFVELKAPKQKPRKLQLVRIKKLKEMGFSVYVLDNVEDIGGVIDDIQTT